MSLLILGLAPPPAAAPAIAPAAAARVFAEARAICGRDHGAFWGRSLCGPILLVEPASRAVVANHADGGGVLAPAGAMFAGVLPASVTITNSPTPWAGLTWTQMLWPLPGDDAVRRVMIAHELYHRIQADLGMPRSDGDNGHLDTLEGRFLLQLEWRALARALLAQAPAARAAAADDALAFRAERYRRFPAAADNEKALELNEGVAEYTGVRVGLIGARAQTAYAVRDLSAHVGDPTFVRSFAYATGPAYGLLLDRYAPAWRGQLKSGPGLDALLRAALPAAPGAPSLDARAASYGAATLRAAEETRERGRQAMLAGLRARFIEGPLVHIPTRQINYEFNPRAVQPLGDAGAVYPHLRVTGPFGVLEADNGALMNKDHSDLAVSALGAETKTLLKGDGWTLSLRPGWTLKPGARAGDWVAVPPP